MTAWTSAGPSVLASFFASLVEFVEALTILLAAGVVRGWRSALLGASAGLVVLAALVLALGSSLAAAPLPILRLVVGALLLMFGLRWLRKAVLRQAGILILHDEVAAFAKETERLRREAHPGAFALDGVAVIAAFKAVVLEGIEVVFIVIALAAGGRQLVPVVVGAALALAVVLLLGVWLRRPLERVPENSLKFGVGVILTSFGTFWVGEGIGLHWPGADIAIGYVMGAFLLLALTLARFARLWNRAAAEPSAAQPLALSARRSTPPGPLGTAVGKLWGVFVDDGWLAGGVLAWLLFAWACAARYPLVPEGECAAFAIGLGLLLSLSVLQRARSHLPLQARRQA